MASDLSPSEKETKEVERLIDKKPPPSRKNTERRAPHHEFRRERIKQDDPDMGQPDKDLSLNHKGISSVLDRLAHRLSEATSNEIVTNKIMSARSATYHGVLQQGNPAGSTNTGFRSLDKRYFGNDHYESIIKYAKNLLDEDWLKYDWEGGAKDASLRAALDLSIHLADSSLYQSKIDSETYNMLLNRLAGWGHDSFSETVYSIEKKNRSASSMSQEHVKNIIKVASDLRNSDPKAAFEIIKNLRVLVSSQAAQESEETEESAPPPAVAQEEESEETQEFTPPPAVGQQEQQEFVGQQELQAQKPGDVVEFNSMGEEDFKKLKDQAKKLFDSKDIETFMQGFGDLHGEIEKKTASNMVQVPLALLVRMAHANPAVRPTLMPILIAAKKKKDAKKKPKKKEEKVSQKDKKKDKKAPPFGGKKAPPFGGKKAPPFGKSKKASVNIDQSDMNW